MDTSPSELERIGRELSGKRRDYGRLNWTKYTTGFDFGIDEAYAGIVEFLRDETRWNTIQEAADNPSDTLEARKAEILRKAFRPFHLSQEMTKLASEMQRLTSRLSAVLNTHRFKVDGVEKSGPDIGRILSESIDRELRRKAFLSRTSVAEPLIENGFLDLLHMRREYAEGMGRENFVSHSLEEQELDPRLFDSWPAEVKRAVPAMMNTRAEFASEFTGSDEVMPWDEAYIASAIAPQLHQEVDMSGFLNPIADLFQMFGFDIGSMNITYDIFPRKHKSEWGYNFPIETGSDSRILANVSNRFNEFRVLLHETGHGVHSFTSSPDEAVLNMGISGITSEGIANLFGSFRTREVFYGRFFSGEDLKKARISFGRLDKWARASQLLNVGRILFDAGLHTGNPTSLKEIEDMRWRTEKELFGTPPYADRPVWANTIHHTTHPVYLHNYLLGDLMCDMLETVFLKREGLGDLTEKAGEFGEFLREEVIAPSGRYTFPELFRRISGEDLSLSLLVNRTVEELGG